MAFNDFLPIPKASSKFASQELDAGFTKDVSRLFKIASFTLGLSGLSGIYTRQNFEFAPYDMKRIGKAIDTDSFVKQGFNKYRELIWKEGWDIVSENDDAANYIKERFDYMEIAMRQPMEDLLQDISDQLVKYGNAFVAKSRGDLTPFFSTRLQSVSTRYKYPVIGYYVVPAETMEIERNAHNQVLKYRQRLDGLSTGYSTHGQDKQPTWQPEEMIHIAMDRKPGRAFGTPFMISVIDDVIALRAMEEDIQNLVHKELFPLYKYKVGTPEAPAEDGEIEAAGRQLENLASDGGLVMPERHDVDTIGGDKQALEADEYLRHFVIRVCVGLGLSPHHLGILGSGGNRSVTDRLDVALYDRIKNYQKKLSNHIRLFILNELLMEGNFNPLVHPAQKGKSDRCEFVFKEIDVDTQVKRENHTIQKWMSNLISLPEARQELGLNNEVEEKELHAYISTKLTADATPAENTAENKSRPANQHGKSTSPKIRRSDDMMDWGAVAELIDDDVQLDIDETILSPETKED